ncbi:MAG: hypothetical protein EOM20_02170 [Spartobacteria bacterium]|nr:hypothetical protein [Spartobacteria bacterium]
MAILLYQIVGLKMAAYINAGHVDYHDLKQDVVLHITRALTKVSVNRVASPDALFAWVYTTAQYKLIDALRKSNRKDRLLHVDPAQLDERAHAASLKDSREYEIFLTDCVRWSIAFIRELPSDMDRDLAFWLFLLGGTGKEYLGVRENLTRGAIDTRVNRLREKWRVFIMGNCPDFYETYVEMRRARELMPRTVTTTPGDA